MRSAAMYEWQLVFIGKLQRSSMAPIVQPIARSDSKVRFMTCLGLEISKRLHRQVYNTMKVRDA